jgi:hypothetical protein
MNTEATEPTFVSSGSNVHHLQRRGRARERSVSLVYVLGFGTDLPRRALDLAFLRFRETDRLFVVADAATLVTDARYKGLLWNVPGRSGLREAIVDCRNGSFLTSAAAVNLPSGMLTQNT